VGSALGWGILAASSLTIGALAGLARPWPNRLLGLVLGFGAGALISAVSFELAAEGVERGSAIAVAAGLALGALAYFVLDGLIARRTGSGRGRQRRVGPDAVGPALALGAFLDGVPEQLVLGLGLAGGETVSAGLVAAIFVSNLPEAIGGAGGMLAAGTPRRTVLRLWVAVTVVCTLCTGIGYAVGDSASGDLQAGIDGFAAGALLVMLVDAMIPEARERSGRPTGLATVLGFALAAGLSAVD
jgi:zinc transporter, ZIP family